VLPPDPFRGILGPPSVLSMSFVLFRAIRTTFHRKWKETNQDPLKNDKKQWKATDLSFPPFNIPSTLETNGFEVFSFERFKASMFLAFLGSKASDRMSREYYYDWTDSIIYHSI
jgi:hypothetical protein